MVLLEFVLQTIHTEFSKWASAQNSQVLKKLVDEASENIVGKEKMLVQCILLYEETRGP